MAPLWRISVAIVVVLTFLYRLAFHDSRVSNFETPPGYSAAKSIAQIEAEEKRDFEKALDETTKEKKVETTQIKIKSPIQAVSVATKTFLKSVKKLASRKLVSKKLAKLFKFKSKKEIQ
jgi:hypothetical protein